MESQVAARDSRKYLNPRSDVFLAIAGHMDGAFLRPAAVSTHGCSVAFRVRRGDVAGRVLVKEKLKILLEVFVLQTSDMPPCPPREIILLE